MGKGSSPRPFSVSQEKFADSWDAIFKKEKEAEESASSTLEGKDDTDTATGSDRT